MQSFAARSGKTPEEEEQRFLDEIPQGRLGDAEEIARLVAFLASDAAPHVTGRSITADGGASPGYSVKVHAGTLSAPPLGTRASQPSSRAGCPRSQGLFGTDGYG